MPKLPGASRKHYRKLVDDFKSISKHMDEQRLREIAETFGDLLKVAFDDMDNADELLTQARDQLRCQRTNNPCNTDTQDVDARVCCDNCVIHLKILEHFEA